MKPCTVCRDIKPLDGFSRDRSRPDGRAHRCRECDSKKARQWQLEHPDRFRETSRAHFEINREHAYAARQAAHARKRMRKFAGVRPVLPIDKRDRELAVAYRLAQRNDACFYCKGSLPNMQSDHYFPISKGGTDHWWNLRRVCQPCNREKDTRCGTWMMLQTVGRP